MQIFYSALADDGIASQGSPFLSLVPLVVIFLIFYFVVIRPQNKKLKEHSNMINSLQVGDRIVTTGGIVGIISKIDDKNSVFVLEVAEGVNIKIMKNFITEKISKK